MIIREPFDQEKDAFNAVANHPMQSWAWGDFRIDTGVEIIRLALFEGNHITKSFQLTIHTVPKLNWKLGYLPRDYQPDDAQIFALKTAAQKFGLIFVKNEPNLYAPVSSTSTDIKKSRKFLESNQHQPARPMFTPYSFVIDLSKPQEELFTNLKSKTRYNVNVAKKHGVKITLDNSREAFEQYIDLWKQTTHRQAFYAHNQDYQRKMWQHMRKADIAHILKATYQQKTLGIWIVFIFNDVIYYPYGASSREHREVMANNLLAWEAILFGKKMNCTKFDMWGSLGPNPNKHDPWYGFHRFKEGYGGELVEFVGSYDYVYDPQKYRIFKLLDTWRWKYLRFRTKLPI